MLKQYFTAKEDQGKIHSPCIEERGGSYFLTFHKETLAGVRKLRVLPMLAKAKAGTEGFFITPRNIEMSGDLLVKFVPREDTCYSYNLPIMSCYGIKTAEVAALVRIERNYKYSFAFQIKDDIFDYNASDELGKPTGNDMKEGKLTLPALYVLNTYQDSSMVDLALKIRALEASDEEIARFIDYVKQHGGLEYAAQVMVDYRNQALGMLPEAASQELKDALAAYIDYVIERKK